MYIVTAVCQTFPSDSSPAHMTVDQDPESVCIDVYSRLNVARIKSHDDKLGIFDLQLSHLEIVSVTSTTISLTM